jgi:hypothetical protein
VLATALAVATASPRDTTPTAVEATRLHGRVTNFHGNPLADARVTVVEISRSALTDQEGGYVITALPAGTYTTTFALIGYGPQTRRVTLDAADKVLDVTLNESLVELPPIQVTASPNATSALTSPQPVDVLGGARLAADHTANLGQTLDRVPGVTAWTTGAGIGKPVIRGLTSSNVLILANGQRTDTQQWADEHSPNIETSDAERQDSRRLWQQQHQSRRHHHGAGGEWWLRCPGSTGGEERRQYPDTGRCALQHRLLHRGRQYRCRLQVRLGIAAGDLYPPL